MGNKWYKTISQHPNSNSAASVKKNKWEKDANEGELHFWSFFFFLNLGQIVAQHSSEGSGELHVYINREFRVVWFGLRS